MAVRKSDADKASIVLFAFILGKVIADGFDSVKKLPPTVVPPRFVMAPAAVVAPVPPLATGRDPVTPVVRGSPVAFVKTPEAGVPKAGVISTGLVNVLLASVSVPANVDKIPVVGKVTDVVAVDVNVVAKAPDVVKLPPKVIVLPVLATPVPPLAPATTPVTLVALPEATALVTNAVVATCVVLSPAVAVGAKGVPVNVGDAKGAFASKAVCKPLVLAIDNAPSAIAVALPTLVTTPVKFAFVVTVAALPVMLPAIGLVTVKLVSVPTLVKLDPVTVDFKVVPPNSSAVDVNTAVGDDQTKAPDPVVVKI